MKQRKEMGHVVMMISLTLDAPEYDELHYNHAIDAATKMGALQVDRLFVRGESAYPGIVARRYTMWRWEWEDEAEATESSELVGAE